MKTNHRSQRQVRRIIGQGAIGAIGAIIGFLITLYTFHVTLQNSRDIQMINLARDLNKDFINDPGFRDMRLSIDRCDKLYKNWGGHYDNDQINQYLNFFDDIGFYWTLGDLSSTVVYQMFGAYIIEAYEYREVRRYIDGFHDNAGQKKAFNYFEILAKKIESDPDFADAVLAAKKCNSLAH